MKWKKNTINTLSVMDKEKKHSIHPPLHNDHCQPIISLCAPGAVRLPHSNANHTKERAPTRQETRHEKNTKTNKTNTLWCAERQPLCLPSNQQRQEALPAGTAQANTIDLTAFALMSQLYVTTLWKKRSIAASGTETEDMAVSRARANLAIWSVEHDCAVVSLSRRPVNNNNNAVSLHQKINHRNGLSFFFPYARMSSTVWFLASPCLFGLSSFH